jgi:hypothetical protein
MSTGVNQNSFKDVVKRIDLAKHYGELFGSLSGRTAAEKLRALRKQYASLAQTIHPDRVNKSDKLIAGDSFAKLSAFAAAARKDLRTNTYGTGAKSNSGKAAASKWTLSGAVDLYDIDNDPYREGDRTMVYRGRAQRLGMNVMVKVAKTPPDNIPLAEEARILRQFTTAKAGSKLLAVAPYMPSLLEVCAVRGAGGSQYVATISREIAGMVSVEDIMKAFPKGLDAPQAAWVARRILAQPIIATMAGVVHAAIVPCHVLVHPVTHEPLHIGWTHAILSNQGKSLTSIMTRYKDFYPPEVFDKVPFTHQMDIFMATKTVIALLGGNVKTNAMPKDVPAAMAELLKSGAAKNPSSRPKDGKVFLDDFTRVVRKEWGSKYRALIMPVA